jgi:S-methylmethionine-dependent homocysteine/selenocysteine methylase
MTHGAASTWQARLAVGATLVVDGGTGSELRRRGMRLHPQAWSALAALTDYDLLRAVHADYIAAGADVVIVNTFAATRFVLEAAGAAGELEKIVRRSVAAALEAREAAGRGDVAIAGSVSCLPPRFDVRAYPAAAQESAAYRELAELLAVAGVDLIALEMLQDDTHGARACEAVRGIGLPFWLGVSCREAAATGELVAYDFADRPLGRFVDALLGFAPSVVNVMHSPPSAVAPALAALRARFNGLLGAYPELGVRSEPGADSELGARTELGAASQLGAYPERGAGLASYAPAWRAAGARVLGGCCGTTPEDVAALSAALRGDGEIAVHLDRERDAEVDEHAQ